MTFASDKLCTRSQSVCVSTSHHEASQATCESGLAQCSPGYHRPLPLHLKTSESCLVVARVCLSSLRTRAADRYRGTTSVSLVVADSDYDAITSLIWFAVDLSQSCRRQYFAPGVAKPQASVTHALLLYNCVQFWSAICSADLYRTLSAMSNRHSQPS